MKAGKVEKRGYPKIDRALAPDDLNQFLDHKRESKRKQQFCDMAVFVNTPQAEALQHQLRLPREIGAITNAGQKPATG